MSCTYRRGAGLAACLVFAALIAACAEGDVEAAPDASTIEWTPCGDAQCGTVEALLDPDQPDSGFVELAVIRVRAASPTNRIGVLMVNPGGPGASGTALVRSLRERGGVLAERFDIVGWDPRGTGATSSLGCDDQIAELYGLDLDAFAGAAGRAVAASAIDAAAACGEDRRLVGNIGSASTAGDIDAIRAALGEDTISYLGFSYGSVLGLEYASRFGDHLRIGVLDGVVDPRQDLEAWLAGQAVAVEEATARLIRECRSCQSDPFVDLEHLVEAARDPGADIGPTEVVRAVIAATYLDDPGSTLVDAVESALDGDSSFLARLSATYGVGSDLATYTAVVCADRVHPVGGPEHDAMTARIAASAPLVGAVIANELAPCAYWPIAPSGNPLGEHLDSIDRPLLLVGNLGDAATPWRDAAAVARILDSATLLTYDGVGHTSYFNDECVAAIVHGALVDGAVPSSPQQCAN